MDLAVSAVLLENCNTRHACHVCLGSAAPAVPWNPRHSPSYILPACDDCGLLLLPLLWMLDIEDNALRKAIHGTQCVGS